ncbi:MAG: shikimate kinase [Actinobacteria bacterium]|nr:MAG: shikimate kinase [Actinomycetota bacterium]
MLERKNIVLIGFMGSGKTVVGRELAKILSYELKDTDSIIEERTKKKIEDIFLQEGEDHFRNIEAQVIDELSSLRKKVISCGGGAILRKENVLVLKETGVLIYLKAPFEVLYDRIKMSTNRPLLKVKEPEQAAKKLLEARQHAYEQVADFSVDVSDRPISEIVSEIEKRVRENS